MTSGPIGSVSQRGTLRIVPGIDIGTTEEPLRQPALPKEVPSPGLPGSTRTTSWPSRCRKLAAATPTMPAPITPIVFFIAPSGHPGRSEAESRDPSPIPPALWIPDRASRVRDDPSKELEAAAQRLACGFLARCPIVAPGQSANAGATNACAAGYLGGCALGRLRRRRARLRGRPRHGHGAADGAGLHALRARLAARPLRRRGGAARRRRGGRGGRADAPQTLPRRARRRRCLRARDRPRRHPPRLGRRDPRGGGGRPHEPLGRGRDACRGIDGARRDSLREAPRPQHPALVLAAAMDLLANLWLGFSVAVTPTNLLFCLIGALVGTLIGVLPGIGPLATISMLLPLTYHFEPVTALIMLAGIYYGAQYGGSTTAILVNLPGESSSAVTTIDGYQMARQGRAGPALAAAALSSFFAGCVATLILVLFAPPLTAVALKFGPAEYFSLVVLSLITSVALAHGSILKAMAMIVLGLLLGLVGTDVYTGEARFTLGLPELFDGLNFVAVAVGVFGIAEILRNLENEHDRDVVVRAVTNLMPTRDDLRRMVGPVLRGTALGSLLGVLPGGGAVLSSFAAYTIEKRLSKTPERFGKGAIEGVAAPEAANNAAAQTSFIPMLTL